MLDTMPASDVTVSGSYIVNKYRVSFMIGAVEFESYVLEYGSAIVAPDALELPGYTFCGWGEVGKLFLPMMLFIMQITFHKCIRYSIL